MTTRNLRNIWPTLLMCAALLGIGGVCGFLIRPVFVEPVARAIDDDADVAGAGHGGSTIVELMETTLENMNLKSGKFEVRDYYKKIRIPAQVVERVPQGRRRITAPIGGRVTKVHIAQGQAIRPGEKLFDFQITDESLSQSQVELLGVLAAIEVNRQKLERLRPLVEKGVVAGKRTLDVEFEINTLSNRRDALKQELSIRGMSDEKISQLIDGKQLMQSIVIVAPEMDPAKETESITLESETSPVASVHQVSLETTEKPNTGSGRSEDEQYYTVESIEALEGSNRSLGESLCELTYHSDLLIKGLAFESDIEKISAANEKGWRFTAQFGEAGKPLVRDNLKLYLVDNHVDIESQTYPIFVEIGNEIVSRTTDNDNRSYVNWRFKPGQRAHLEVPIEVWEKQVVAPLTAIVREGPEAFVFQKISHTHETPEGTVFEFKKVPVKVLHTDKLHAVLAKDLKLDVYEEYALDQAYKLNLALKQAAGGGGDPHAGHSH